MGSMKSMASILAMAALSAGIYDEHNMFHHMKGSGAHGSGSRNEDNINKKLKQLGLDGSVPEDLLRFIQTFARHVEDHKEGVPIFTIRGFNVWGLNLKNANKKLTKMLKDCGLSPYSSLQDIAEKIETVEAKINEKLSES